MNKLISKKRGYTVLIIFLIIFGIIYIYESKRLKSRLFSQNFDQLIVSLDDNDSLTANKIYNELESKRGLYANMVKLIRASEQANKGELKEAKVKIKNIINYSDTPLIRDPAYIRLLKIMGELKELDEIETFVDLVESDSYKEYVKYEIAKIFERYNDKKRALKYYKLVEEKYLTKDINDEIKNKIRMLND